MNKDCESFEDLRIWQEGMKLCVDIYRVFKECKDFGLRDQIRKSAVSIPSNIAERFERKSNKEFIHFLYVAKASSGELRTQLQIAMETGMIQHDIANELIDRAKKVSSMICNFIKARKEFDVPAKPKGK